MGRGILTSESENRSLLKHELESLGLLQIRLNEFNDAKELDGLVTVIKESFLKEYHSCYPSECSKT